MFNAMGLMDLGITSKTSFPHCWAILVDMNDKSGLYYCFHLALFNYLGSFGSWKRIKLFAMLLLSTHSHDTSKWGSRSSLRLWSTSHLSVHLAISAVTPAGSVHKSRGDNVVRMRVQLKR